MSSRASSNLHEDDSRRLDDREQKAHPDAVAQPSEDILANTRAVIHASSQAQLATFVRERFARLELLLAMASDEEWSLSSEDRQRLLNALASCSGSTTD